jgi:hypothetical protein
MPYFWMNRRAYVYAVVACLSWIRAGSSDLGSPGSSALAARFETYVSDSDLNLDIGNEQLRLRGGPITELLVRFCLEAAKGTNTTGAVAVCHDEVMHELRAQYPQIVVRPELPLDERVRFVRPVDGGKVLFGDQLNIHIEFPHVPFGRTRYGMLFVNGIIFPSIGDVFCPLPVSQAGPCPNRPDGDHETNALMISLTARTTGALRLQFFLLDRSLRPIVVEGRWESATSTTWVVESVQQGMERASGAVLEQLFDALPTLHSPLMLEAALICAGLSESKRLWPVELAILDFQRHLNALQNVLLQRPKANRYRRSRSLTSAPMPRHATVRRAASWATELRHSEDLIGLSGALRTGPGLHDLTMHFPVSVNRGGELWRILTHACSHPTRAGAQQIADLCGDRQTLHCIWDMSRTAWLLPSLSIPDAIARHDSRSNGHGKATTDASKAKLPHAALSLLQRVWHVYALDRHTAIVRDVYFVLTSVLGLRVEITEQSFATLCGSRNVCVHDPRLMHGFPTAVCGANTIGLCAPKCSSAVTRQLFFDAFKSDAVIQQTDFFLCSVPTALCEIFLPFNKTIIAVNAFRIEHGRENQRAFSLWARHLELLHSNPLHVLIANSLSDQLHTEYWTGVKPPLVESLCMYYATTYQPDSQHNEILVGLKSFDVHHEGPDQFQDMILRMNMEQPNPLPMAKLNEKYKNTRVDFATLALHPALIDIPYMYVCATHLRSALRGEGLYDFLVQLSDPPWLLQVHYDDIH